MKFFLSCITVAIGMASAFVTHSSPAFSAARLNKPLFSTPPTGQPDTIEEFIAQIGVWYAEIPAFSTAYDAAIANVQDLPPDVTPGSPTYFDWKEASITTLQQFFRDWYDWSPHVETGLDYIQKFAWMYYESPIGVAFVTTDYGRLMTEHFVVVNGAKYDESNTYNQELIAEWELELGDEMDDYIRPPGGYQTFNEFFIRDLIPGARPIFDQDDDSKVASPADAVLNMINDNLVLDDTLKVKTTDLSVRELLNNSPYAESFVGGTALSCILMPDVYHWYHSPVNGTVIEANQDVAGAYFGIDDFPELMNGGNVGYDYPYAIFEQFRRGYLIIETQKYGNVAMIPVGLNTIASVVFEDKFKNVPPGERVPITKGEKVGYFQYGGSMNILLFQAGVFEGVTVDQGRSISKLNEKTALTTIRTKRGMRKAGKRQWGF